MSIFKCKMCGGTLEFNQGDTIGICDSCGTKQTLPNTNDDVIANLYNRANNLRLKSEFDRAAQVYEDIVNRDDSQAEAHWGIVLCKYGIEYVDDPATGKKIPTCHRASYEAIRSDADYLAAIDYSDGEQQAIYKSWIDYFIMGDIYVLGFGFDFSEFDLWWLLNRKYNEKASHGKLYFFEPEQDEGKTEKERLLELFNAKIEHCNIIIPKIKDDKSNKDEVNSKYFEFYKHATDRIKELVKENK